MATTHPARIAVGAAIVVGVFGLGTSATAQQPAPVSLESVRAALQKSAQSSLVIPAVPLWGEPRSTRFGMLTLIPPDTNGGIVKVSVPVGELVSRASRAMSNARHRRAERKADERVLRALREFQEQRPKP